MASPSLSGQSAPPPLPRTRGPAIQWGWARPTVLTGVGFHPQLSGEPWPHILAAVGQGSQSGPAASRVGASDSQACPGQPTCKSTPTGHNTRLVSPHSPPSPLPTTSGLWHLLRPPCGPSPASPVPGLRPGPCPAPTGWLLPSFPHDGWLGPLLQEPPPTSPDPLLLPTPHTPCRAGKVNAKEVGRPERSLLLAVVWGKRAPPEGREPSLGVAHSRQHPWPPWTACLPHLPPPRQSSGTAGPGFPLPLSGPPTLTGTSPPCPRPTAHSPARGGQPRRCPAGSLPSPAEQDRSQAQRQHGVSCLSFCQEPPGAAAQSLGGHEGRQLR